MDRVLLVCFTLLISSFAYSQTIISEDIDFADTSQVHLLQTDRGDVLIGRLERIENDSFYFQLRGTENIIAFRLNTVRAVWPAEGEKPELGSPSGKARTREGKRRIPPATNQMIYSATALPFAGDGSYRNTLILWNQADYQPSEHISFGGGMLVPVLFMIRAQTQVSFSEFVHAGITIQHHQVIVDPDGSGSTHPYAMVTVGDRDKYLNFTYGYWFQHGTFADDPFPMVSLGGSITLSPKWRFFAEAMAILNGFDNYIVPSFNFSTFNRRSMLEFGVAAIPESDFPLIPILSYSYLF